MKFNQKNLNLFGFNTQIPLRYFVFETLSTYIGLFDRILNLNVLAELDFFH